MYSPLILASSVSLFWTWAALARLYLQSLTDHQDLILAFTVGSYEEIDPLLVSGEIDAALVIPPGFADSIYDSQPTQVQAIIDGADPISEPQIVNPLSARSGVYVASAGAPEAALQPSMAV